MLSIRIVTSTPARHQDAAAVVADGSMRGDDEALAAPLSVLGLTIRASNALLNNGFSTVGDVVAKTERELLWQLPGVGQGTLTGDSPASRMRAPGSTASSSGTTTTTSTAASAS